MYRRRHPSLSPVKNDGTLQYFSDASFHCDVFGQRAGRSRGTLASHKSAKPLQTLNLQGTGQGKGDFFSLNSGNTPSASQSALCSRVSELIQRSGGEPFPQPCFYYFVSPGCCLLQASSPGAPLFPCGKCLSLAFNSSFPACPPSALYVTVGSLVSGPFADGRGHRIQ